MLFGTTGAATVSIGESIELILLISDLKSILKFLGLKVHIVFIF
jgi:hypothetical protein